MPELLPLEQMDAGGVDSRSNPLNMPRNRALRCLNWVPKQAGFWELRYGYSSVSMSSVTASAIHSMFPYRTWDGTKYVLYMQGTTWKVLNTGTGTVTTPTIKGAAIGSSAKGAGFFANNRFHYGNGTDQKFFDATFWRNSGLGLVTDYVFSNIPSVQITEGVRELTTTQASTITMTPAGGGSFPADLLNGHLIYVGIFDVTVDEIGPATISVGSARVKVTLNQKITVANMPDLSGVNVNWVKLIGGTGDGRNTAYFFTNTSTAITSCTRSGTTLTVISAGHGLSSGDVVGLSGTTNFDAIHVVGVIDVNTFAVTILTGTGANSTGGTCQRIVKAASATTSIDVLANTQYATYQANQNLGLAASTIGGPNAGYKFYVSLYNPTTGQVGNRTEIPGRALQTAYRSNWRLGGLGDASGTDSEWTTLIGRTGDGALVPYPMTDNAGNWLTFISGITNQLIAAPSLDGGHELPTRNGVIPAQCNMFCVAGDYCYAGDTGSPTLRRSGSLADDRAGIFTGRPEQSWAPNDIDTFPTGEALAGMFEVDQEVFCGSINDSAISVNLAGIQQWVGPWNIGIAGRRAGTKCGAQGFYWLSGDKQLCTFSEGAPIVVSEEYELAELSQIGDQYLSTVELVYYRQGPLGKEEVRIEAQKSDGTPYTVIHDFRLRDYSAPGSYYGQGYASQFQGPLGTAFTSAQVRDGNGRLQVYCGASTGRLYQLYSGADDVGSQYTGDLILLANGGTKRPNVPELRFYGDGNTQLTVGRNFQTSLTAGSQFSFEPPNMDEDDVAMAVPGSENDYLYRVPLVPPEVQHIYLRFQLTSHSGDGNLTLNSPPHLPLENYGRLYELIPIVGDEREA